MTKLGAPAPDSRPAIRVMMLAVVLFALVRAASAQLGSPDSYAHPSVGPYEVLVAAHPPEQFPGEEEIDLRFAKADGVSSASVSLDDGRSAALKLNADGTATGTVWRSKAEPHALHLTIEGAHGAGYADIELPALGLAGVQIRGRSFTSNPLIWAAAMLFYFACIAVLAGGRGQRRRRQLQVAVTFLALSVVLFAVALVVHPKKPAASITLSASVSANERLTVRMEGVGESFADITPVAGKVMHTVLVREPLMDAVAVLHPHAEGNPGTFVAALPKLPAGTYRVFVEVVHLARGEAVRFARSDTAATYVMLPEITGAAGGDADDVSARTPAAGAATKTSANSGTQKEVATLEDGYTMELVVDSPLKAREPHAFLLSLRDPRGNVVNDASPYLGSAAEVIVLSANGQVYGTAHPNGTQLQIEAPASAQPHGTAVVPYGFAAAGRYRMFVLMKHGSTVEMGAFDLDVR